ncbi:MAG: hypothetical protein J6A23_05045 [Thermoguttaceae bacterium]|nr:hypothetical protein [Thermoguttaceae bacterium]
MRCGRPIRLVPRLKRGHFEEFGRNGSFLFLSVGKVQPLDPSRWPHHAQEASNRKIPKYSCLETSEYVPLRELHSPKSFISSFIH